MTTCNLKRIHNKHRKCLTKHTIPSISMIFEIVLIVLVSGHLVAGGCRSQERDPCETVCIWNETSKEHSCNLRAAVILPQSTKVEISLPRVGYYYIELHIIQ